MREANSCWFYALAFSLLGALHGLYTASQDKAAEPKEENEKSGKSKKSAKKTGEKKAVGTSSAVNTTALWHQIMGESCDILIPLELLDWMPTGDLVIGGTMILGTLLSIRGIWARV